MTKKEIIETLKRGANTKIDKKVLSIILSHEKNYRNIKNVEDRFDALFSDLMHGCQTGIVSELIYYNDTTKFFNTYRKDILTCVNMMLSDGLLKTYYDFEDSYYYLDLCSNITIKIKVSEYNKCIIQSKFDVYEKNTLTWLVVDYSIAYFYSIYESIKEA